MGLNKTLYIKDEDAPVWEESKNYFRDTLTTFLTHQLKSAIASKKAAAQGFERIILSYRENGLPKTKAFFGRWVISPEDAWDPDPWGDPQHFDMYALAITAKGNVVVFNFLEPRREEGKYGHAIFHWFGSMEEADSRVPSDLIATAMERMGVPVEELDI